MSLTKLPLGRNNSVMTSLFPPRESFVGTSRDGKLANLFYGVGTAETSEDKDILQPFLRPETGLMGEEATEAMATDQPDTSSTVQTSTSYRSTALHINKNWLMY
jgi:hypothetical protein